MVAALWQCAEAYTRRRGEGRSLLHSEERANSHWNYSMTCSFVNLPEVSSPAMQLIPAWLLIFCGINQLIYSKPN